MNEGELQGLFRSSGALLSGHFLLSSGLHSDQYFQCALLLCDTALAGRLGAALAARMPAPWSPAAVVAPALGGVVIGHETARALRARSLFSERKDGAMELRRGFRVAPGERCVVVEDVITTGKSTREVIALLRALGAEPVGALALVVRGERPPELGVPFESLARLPAPAWAPEACPLCARGVPCVKPGSRENPSTRG